MSEECSSGEWGFIAGWNCPCALARADNGKAVSAQRFRLYGWNGQGDEILEGFGDFWRDLESFGVQFNIEKGAGNPG